MFTFATVRSLVAGTLVLVTGCGSNMMGTEAATQLVSVSPRGGTTSVAVSTDIVLTFSQAMMVGMEQYMVLHQGSVSGSTSPMSCRWSDGQRTLTCRPGQPLAAGTRYTIHVGGGMMDSGGLRVGTNRNGMGMGGQWVTGGMMGGQAGMMGSGWANTNGSYGMVFEFMTQ